MFFVVFETGTLVELVTDAKPAFQVGTRNCLQQTVAQFGPYKPCHVLMSVCGRAYLDRHHFPSLLLNR